MFGSDAISEGIETTEQLEAVNAMGIGYGLGHLLARQTGASQVRLDVPLLPASAV